MPTRGPVLALDWGTKRIGMAVSDEGGVFAFPAGVLERRGQALDLEALGELARARGVRRIVVGLPVHMDGREGPEARAARAFAGALAGATGLPVDLLDERWTTREAERTLREARPRRRRGERLRVDDAAATLLLRTFLEREDREVAG